MIRGRQRKDLFDDLFAPFDEDFETMREHMERTMAELFGNALGSTDDPWRYGFVVETGRDGRRIVHEIGDAQREDVPIERGVIDREPLIDIIEGEDKVTIIVELPGVEKDDIEIRAEGRGLNIDVDTERKRFSKRLDLPHDVVSDDAHTEYRNGVLTISLHKRPEIVKGEGIDIL